MANAANTPAQFSKAAQVKFARETFRNLQNAFEPLGWSNPLDKLLRETQREEKGHRGMFSTPRNGMTNADASKVLALAWLAKFHTGRTPRPTIGALLDSTTTFVYAAAIVEKFGEVVASVLTPEVAERAAELDYAELMN